MEHTLDTVGQLGAAVVLVYMVWQIVKLLIAKRNGSTHSGVAGSGGAAETAGAKPVEFWQRAFRTEMDSALEASVIPILERQTAIADKQTEMLRETHILMREFLRRAE